MGKSNRVVEWLVNWDMYGHPIGVSYKGGDAFKSKLGSLCSIVMYCVMFANFVTILQAFNDGSKQDESSQITVKDRF